jgi:adenosylhomocysteinase
MSGFQVTTMEEAAPLGQIFVTTTGCRDILTGDHFNVMPNDAIVCSKSRFKLLFLSARLLLSLTHISCV